MGELITSITLADTLTIIMRTCIIFFAAFTVLRLLGKRRLSHMTYLDLLLIISLGSAVGDVMIYDESTAHLMGSLIAIILVGVIVKTLEELASRYTFFHTIVIGNSAQLVADGKIIPHALERHDFSEQQLNELLREKGVTEIRKVREAYIEHDGEISVVLAKARRHRKRNL